MSKNVYNRNVSTYIGVSVSGSVSGPVLSTDNAVARFDGTGGTTLQDSIVTITDTGLIDNIEALDITATAANPGGANALWINSADGNKLYRGAVNVEQTGGGSGDVVGPASSVVDGIPLFADTTGKLLKDSAIRMDDSNSSLRIQSGGFPTPLGLGNVYLGHDVMNTINNLNSSDNTVIGTNVFSLNPDIGNVAGNTLIGANVCQNSSAANAFSNNTIIGYRAGFSLTGTSGQAARNILIGYQAGELYTDGETDNLILGNLGVPGDNNVIRIGSDAAHDTTYIHGIYLSDTVPNASTRGIAVNSDNQLIPYVHPISEISFSDFVTTQTINTPVLNTFYTINLAATTFLTNNATVFSTASPGFITYSGLDTIIVELKMTLSVQPVTNNDTCSYAFFKNGVLIPNSISRRKFSTTVDWGSVSKIKLVEISNGDTLSIKVANNTSTSGIVFGSYAFVVK